jgi:hypothetical protein
MSSKEKKTRGKNLYKAAESGDLQRVNELLTVRKNGSNINKLYVSQPWSKQHFSKGLEHYPQGKETALYKALADGCNKVAVLLLQNGAKLTPAEYNIDPNRNPPNRNPPFKVKVEYSYRNPYQPSSYYVHEGSSVHPLCIAVRVGNYEGAKLVLTRHPNLDQKILDNALFHAVVRCPSSLGTLLVKHGANPNAMYAGRTPLIELCREYFIYKANAQKREAHRAQIIPWIQLLVFSGADINLVDTNGNSALMNLCSTRKQFKRNNYLDMAEPADAVTELLNHNADMSILNNMGQNALMLAWGEKITALLHQEEKKRQRHIARLVVNRKFHTMGKGPGVARGVGDEVVKDVALFKQFTNLHL